MSKYKEPKEASVDKEKRKSLEATLTKYSVEPIITTSASTTKSATSPAQKLEISEADRGRGHARSQISEPSYTAKSTQPHMAKDTGMPRHHVIYARHHNYASGITNSQIHIFINERGTNYDSLTPAAPGFDAIVSVEDISTVNSTTPWTNQLIGNLWRIKYDWTHNSNALQVHAHWRTLKATFASGHIEEFEVLVPGYENSFAYTYGSSGTSYNYVSGGCNTSGTSIPDFPVVFGDFGPWNNSSLGGLYQFIQTNIINNHNPSGIWANGAALIPKLSSYSANLQLKLNGSPSDNFYVANQNGGGALYSNVPVGTLGKQKIGSIVASVDANLYQDHLDWLSGYDFPNGQTVNWSNLTGALESGSFGSTDLAGFCFQYYVEYTENLPTCTAPTYTIDGCNDDNNMAYWGYTGTDCAGTAIPAPVLADWTIADWYPGSCCPTCIHASADDITYSSQPLTLSANGTDPTTNGGTDGYIDVTILDGGFDVNGTPQGLPTGTANYTFVVRNQDAADTMCGNTAGKGVGSGAVANSSFTFGNSVPSNSNGGLLQTGATGTASYAASSAQGYVPGGSDLGTTNSEGFRAGTYDVYVFDSSSTVCLGQTTVTLAEPFLTVGCGESAALNYDSGVGLSFPSACHYCEASTGALQDGNDDFVEWIAQPSTGSGYTVVSPTTSTATDGSISIDFSATSTFQAYINNIVDGSSLQNADYKIELYRWDTQTAAGNIGWIGTNNLTGFNAGTTQVGSTINNQGNGWNVTLDSATLGGTFVYGYYTVKLYVDDPDDTVEQEQCYYLVDIIVPVPACVDGGTATTFDGVVISDWNLYFHDATICSNINNFCCDTPVLAQSGSSTTCNVEYTVDILCNPAADVLITMLEYDSGGVWSQVPGGTQTLTSSTNNIQITFDNSIFASNYGNGTYRVKVISQYSNSADCIVYSNSEYVTLGVFGCTDPLAQNYNPAANCDSGCSYCVNGCTDPAATNYNPAATCDDGSCVYPLGGCTDATASNFNPLATFDDGTCQYLDCGCTDPLAYNYGYNIAGQFVGTPPPCDDGNCQFCNEPPMQVSFTGDAATCLDPATCTYNCDGTIELTVASDTGCTTYTIVYMYFFCGISNSNVYFIQNQQYSTGTTILTGLCPGHVWTLVLEDCNGCQQQLDIGVLGSGCGACGCTDPGAINYDATAVTDDGSCEYCGCTDDGAINYNPGATANCDPDTCIFPPLLPPCIPPTIDQTYNQLEVCIAENGFNYYKKVLSGQIDDCSIMNFWKLTLIDYLLKRRGLDCIYNCADVNTPDPSDVYISCEELWITGGTTTGLNDPNVNTLVPAVGTTSDASMFGSGSLIELWPGDVIKHHNSGNIWIFYGPAQGSPASGTLIAGLDPENASGNASGYWGYCNNNMRYISNSNNINYIDNFINFVNTFCKDCENNMNLFIPGNLSKTNWNYPSSPYDGLDGIDDIEI